MTLEAQFLRLLSLRAAIAILGIYGFLVFVIDITGSSLYLDA